MIGTILYSFSVIFGSLFLGYFIQKKGLVAHPKEVSEAIVKNTFRFVSPVILCLSFWKLDLRNAAIWTLPLIGLIIATLRMAIAMYLVRMHRLTPPQKGSFITSAMFSNVGYTLGGFLCFVLFGEIGLALAIMYTLYYTPYFYTVGFYVARHYAQERKPRPKRGFTGRILEDVRFFPFLGFVLGAGLNFSGIPRPEPLAYVNRFVVPLATLGYFSSIGLTFRFGAVKRYKSVCLSVSAIKFLISPLIGLTLAYLMGYPRILGGLPMKIVIIESSMPVAFSALLLTVLFDIDRDLSNSCWLVTTFMMIIVIPLLVWFL